MRNLFFKQLLILFYLCPTIILAKGTLYPKIVENDQEFYLYKVEQSEGLWSISKKFGVTQAELHRYNPEISQGLKFGTTLKIPVRIQVFIPQQAEQIQNKNYVIHVVERSQTLYSIAKQHKVSIEKIIELNPSAAETLKIGDSLKIPQIQIVDKENNLNENDKVSEIDSSLDTSIFIYHEVKRKETLYSISKKYGVEINVILESNDIKTYPKKGDILRIIKNKKTTIKESNDSIIGMRNTTTTKPIDTTNNFRIAILLPFKLNLAGADRSTEKFVDFYRGILLATNEAKKQGISSTLFVYDTGTTEIQIDSILTKKELKDVDLIIGPAYTNQVQKVTTFAQKHGIYTTIPFTQKIKDIDRNPYIIQFNPSQEIQTDITKQKLLKRLAHRHFIIAYLKQNQNEGEIFADSLIEYLKINQAPYSRCIINTENADSICQVAIKQNAVLLLASSEQKVVHPILNIINRHRIGSNLELIGFEHWGHELLNNSKPIYFSSLFLQTSVDAESYEKKYEHYFGSAKNTYPKFDRLGYDIMKNMFAMLNESKGKNGLIFPQITNIQSDMVFKKMGEKGGWINENIYLIHLKE